MYRFLMIFTTVFLLFPLSSFAAGEADLYVAEQRVATQDEAARDAAASKALQLVLLKVVGDRAPLESLSLEAVSKVAPSLVTQHEYFNANATKAAQDNTAPEQLAVRFQFDEGKVNQQLLAWGLPVWDRARPDTLLLIIKDVVGEKDILTEDDALAGSALKVAEERGIPVLLPLMDLNDYQTLDLSALWSGDFSASTPFINRYRPRILATARMASEGDGQWRIQWQFNFAEERIHWQSRGGESEAIQTGMESFADNIARQFSHVKATIAHPFLLEIDGVLGFVAHQRLMQFLSGLTYAENVQQQSLTKGVLTVSLDYFGDESALRAVISGNTIMVPLADIINADRLYYQVGS